MSLGTILLIVLVLSLLGVIPTWGHSRNWGYGPSGTLGPVLVAVVVLLLAGKIWRPARRAAAREAPATGPYSKRRWR